MSKHAQRRRPSGISTRDPRGDAPGRTDLLLINASNFPGQPVYPYGLVQVRALAKQRGLRAEIVDLFGVPKAAWAKVLGAHVEAGRPRLLGVHLRQADSVVHRDYARQHGLGYHPVDDARHLIGELRALSDAPIAVGGFGFSTHPERLFRALRPELGVVGGADALLDAFELVARRADLSGVPNLALPEGEGVRLTQKVYFPPFDGREYDDELIGELERFYSTARLYGDDPPTVAVELARGCPFQCYFCTEPKVKGTEPHVRDLDVVMEELRFLRQRGIGRIWLVCSELNLGSADLALSVAERILALNASPGPCKVRWSAYHLPRWLSRADLELLFRSGFAGGWNDYPSLDDENLSKTRVPYRARHALAYLDDLLALQPQGADGKGARLSLFLGNAYATPETLRCSLERFEEGQLSERFASASIGTATRAFDGSSRFPAPPGLELSRSFGPAGAREEVDAAYPTFYESPALREAFGSTEELLSFFRYAETSLFSVAHRGQRDWCGFLRETATPSRLVEVLECLGPLPSVDGLPAGLARQVEALLALFAVQPLAAAERLYWQPSVDDDARRVVAGTLAHHVTAPALAALGPILGYLGLPADHRSALRWSTYRVVRQLGRAYDTREALLSDVRREFRLEEASLELWALQRFLFEGNVVLAPAYNRVLCGAAETGERGASA